jgi:hypothetical protein
MKIIWWAILIVILILLGVLLFGGGGNDTETLNDGVNSKEMTENELAKEGYSELGSDDDVFGEIDENLEFIE